MAAQRLAPIANTMGLRKILVKKFLVSELDKIGIIGKVLMRPFQKYASFDSQPFFKAVKATESLCSRGYFFSFIACSCR